MNVKFFWNPLCVVLAFALTACGGGSSDPASPREQYTETVGPNGERVVVLSPKPGQFVHLGDTIQFVVRVENSRIHTTPTPEAVQAAQDYWQARHTAGAAPISEQKMQAAVSTVPNLTTPTLGWLHQSSAAEHPTAGTAVSHFKNPDIILMPDANQLIYSIPSLALVSNFSDHHLEAIRTDDSGLSVKFYTSLQDNDGYYLGASTSVSINIVP